MGIALHRCDLSTVTLVNRIQEWHPADGQEFDELVASDVLDQADHDRLRQTWRIEMEQAEIGYLVLSRPRMRDDGAGMQEPTGLRLYIRPDFRDHEVTDRARRLARDLARSLDAAGGALPPLTATGA